MGFIQSRLANAWTVLVVIGLLIILSGLGLIYVNRSGSDIGPVNDITTTTLPADGPGITGWTFLDKDSIHIGGTVNYSISVLFDPGKVLPDLEIFEKSVDVTPLEKTEIRESQYFLNNGISKYVVEYRLQAVNVALDTSYQLDPVIIYYTTPDAPELRSLEISSPSLHIIGFYPSNISTVELKQPAGKIVPYTASGRIFLGLGGIALITLVVIVMAVFFRRNSLQSLSETEKLWLQYQQAKLKPDEIRAQMSVLEKIFTALIKLKLNIKPSLFWSGKISGNSFWNERLSKARSVLRNIYNFNGPDKNELGDLITILDDSFAQALTEEKRNTLKQPSLIRKFISQKYIMAGCLTGTVFGLLMSYSAIWPDMWLPENIKRYNTLVDMLNHEQYSDDIANGFLEVGKEFQVQEYKAAAFYNSGTLLADNLQEIGEEQALTVGDVFSNVATDERILQDAEDILEILTTNVDRYRQSELHLREAVRASRVNENIARNLEIVIKRRKAALKLINDLLNTGDIQQVQMEELLNLLESQMALDFEMDEGKEAPGYYIGEEF